MLAPQGIAQEAVLGPFVFFARYGTAWVDAWIAEWTPLAPEHAVGFLSCSDTA